MWLWMMTSAVTQAQMVEGEVSFKLENPSGSLGSVLVTDATPPTGFAATSEYWDWDAGWPDADFNAVVDSTVTVDSSADYTDDAAFPSAATTKLPGSIGSDDAMYAISVCSGSPQVCTGAGYLWVEDAGATLHWYLRADWTDDRILSSSTEIAHFDHLVAAPGNNDDFRYLELDRQ